MSLLIKGRGSDINPKSYASVDRNNAAVEDSSKTRADGIVIISIMINTIVATTSAVAAEDFTIFIIIFYVIPAPLSSTTLYQPKT